MSTQNTQCSEGNARLNWMFSRTTLACIWLSGFAGMDTTPFSCDQPSFARYASNASPNHDAINTSQ